MAEEKTPVAAAEPPKADPLAKPAAPKVATLKLNPMARKPVIGSGATVALKPGLKLPPKPGLAAGVKLPPKPGATVSAMRPGLKLPTQTALKPGLKLPTKPVIRKPGATVAAAPLPKPITPAPVVEKPVEAAPAPVAAAPVAPVVEAPKPVVEKPVEAAPAPVVEAPAAPVAEVKPAPVAEVKPAPAAPVAEAPAVTTEEKTAKSIEALKSVTQKLKSVTQEVPQQAILHKTGIVADSASSDVQKEAAKHKTARISLSEAIGVAPVKSENVLMKTIRIKRPVGIPGNPAPAVKKEEKPVEAAPAEMTPVADLPPVEEKPAETPSSSITQRKTLKIARPAGGVVRPSGKFGVKRPSQATTVVKKPVDSSVAAAGAPAGDVSAEIADIPDIPAMAPVTAAPVDNGGPAWLWSISVLVQAAACVAIGALAWFLYQNTQISYF